MVSQYPPSIVTVSGNEKLVCYADGVPQTITSEQLSSATSWPTYLYNGGLIPAPTNGNAKNYASDSFYASNYTTLSAAYAAALSFEASAITIDNGEWVADASITFVIPVVFRPGSSLSCGTHAVTFSQGFVAPDTQQVFYATDYALITLPVWQRLTPFHFGAMGNYVSYGSPGYDDGPALNAWAAMQCDRVMPRAKYGTTQTVLWNGDLTDSLNAMYCGINADHGAWIVQLTDGIPVMSFYGARGEWRFPNLAYAQYQGATFIATLSDGSGGAGNTLNVTQILGSTPGRLSPGMTVFFGCTTACTITAQVSGTTGGVGTYTVNGSAQNIASTTMACANYGSAAGIVTPKPGVGGGFYMNSIPFYNAPSGAAIGFFNPRSITSTLASNALSGANTIVVNDVRTPPHSNFPWTPSMYIEILLDGAGHNWFLTRIKSIDPDGVTITLVDNLPSAASSGNAVGANGTNLASTGSTTYSPSGPALFSNTWNYVYIQTPFCYGWLNTSFGTQDIVLNRYIQGPNPAAFDPANPNTTGLANPYPVIMSAVYETGRSGDTLGIENIEHFGTVLPSVYFNVGDYSDANNFGDMHFEGVRLMSDGIGFIGSPCQFATFGKIQVSYCTMSSPQVSDGGVLYPTSAQGTALGAGRGKWSVRVLELNKCMFSPGVASLVRDGSNGRTSVVIDAYAFERDAGIYPGSVLSYPINYGNPLLGNLMPPDCVGYLFNADMTVTTQQRVYMPSFGQYSVDGIVGFNPSVSLTQALVGFKVAGGDTVSTALNVSVSALTGAGTRVNVGVASAEANKIRTSINAVFLYLNTAQTTRPSGVTGSTSYLTGRNGGDKNTDLGFINFVGAQTFVIGQIVDISGSVTSALNGRFEIVDVPNPNQIVVYVDSVSPVGTAGSPISDPAISVRVLPTATFFITGQQFPSVGSY